jgi:hypothetical protein
MPRTATMILTREMDQRLRLEDRCGRGGELEGEAVAREGEEAGGIPGVSDMGFSERVDKQGMYRSGGASTKRSPPGCPLDIDLTKT